MRSSGSSLNLHVRFALLGSTLIFAGTSTQASAQTSATPVAPHKSQEETPNAVGETPRLANHGRDTNLDPLKTFYLKAGGVADYSNEIVTSIRVMLDPRAKVYLIPSVNAIVVRGAPEDLLTAQKIIEEVDRPKPNYRLTYTITESDNGKRVGIQHFAMEMVPGARTTLKNGSKVPVATGSYNSGSSSSQTQFTYLDVGLNFDATIDAGADGVKLRSKVEQSGAIEDKLILGISEPIIRQTVLEGTTTLIPGKSATLGSLDVAASTRHLEIEVILEPIR